MEFMLDTALMSDSSAKQTAFVVSKGYSTAFISPAECNSFSEKKAAYIKTKLAQVQNKALETECLIKEAALTSFISLIN